MSHSTQYAQFFCQLSSLGSSLGHGPLRDGARALLLLMPPDRTTMERLLFLFKGSPAGLPETTIDTMFFSASPAQVLYHLEVLYTMLMPALDPMSEKAFDFQFHFMISGEIQIFLDMLTKNNFMSNADMSTKRSAYLCVLKICKFGLSVVGNILVRLNDDTGNTECVPEGNSNESVQAMPIMFLRQALRSVPSHTSEQILRQVSVKLSQVLAEHILSGTAGEKLQAVFSQALTSDLPDMNTILAMVRIAWAASSSSLHCVTGATDVLHALCDPAAREEPLYLHPDDIALCKEDLECLCLSLVLNPGVLGVLCRDKLWHTLLMDLVLLCPSRAVRLAAAEQFLVICTCGAASRQALLLIVPLLFSVLDTMVLENADTSHEYFQLLCRLVNCAYLTNCPLSTAESLLASEIVWLRKASIMMRDGAVDLNNHAQEALLEGHFGLARELLCFMSPDKKQELGADDSKGGLIRELIEDFIFPASKLMLQLTRTGQMSSEPSVPVCSTPQTQAAAFELLIALCVGCVPNCRQLVTMLTDMFYSGMQVLFFLHSICKYNFFLRTQSIINRMGLLTTSRSPTYERICWIKKCRCNLLYEFCITTTVYGRIDSGWIIG